MILTWWHLALGAFGLVVGKVVLDLATKEAQGRLDRLPFLILKVARWRLPAELRESMHDDWWIPDLQERLDSQVSRPITRLVKGMRFASSLAISAGRTARAAGVPSVWVRARQKVTAFSGRAGARTWLPYYACGMVMGAMGLDLEGLFSGTMTGQTLVESIVTGLVGFIVVVGNLRGLRLQGLRRKEALRLAARSVWTLEPTAKDDGGSPVGLADPGRIDPECGGAAAGMAEPPGDCPEVDPGGE